MRREARRAASNKGVTKQLIGRKPLQIFDPLGQRDSQLACRLHLAGRILVTVGQFLGLLNVLRAGRLDLGGPEAQGHRSRDGLFLLP